MPIRGILHARRRTKKVQPVLGGFDAERLRTERLWATAPDGVRVPVSLVYRRDLAKLDGTDPLLLDGCGTIDRRGVAAAQDCSRSSALC